MHLLAHPPVLRVQSVDLLRPQNALLVCEDVQALVHDHVVYDFIALIQCVGLDDAQRAAAGCQPRCEKGAIVRLWGAPGLLRPLGLATLSIQGRMAT
jgi:hypothetical protein